MLIDYPKGTQDSTIVAGKGPKKKKKTKSNIKTVSNYWKMRM